MKKTFFSFFFRFGKAPEHVRAIYRCQIFLSDGGKSSCWAKRLSKSREK